MAAAGAGSGASQNQDRRPSLVVLYGSQTGWLKLPNNPRFPLAGSSGELCPLLTQLMLILCAGCSREVALTIARAVARCRYRTQLVSMEHFHLVSPAHAHTPTSEFC